MRSIQKPLLYLTFLEEWFRVPLVVNGKGKAIPLQAWTDPEGSRR